MEPVFWILPGGAVPIEIYREASNSARQNPAEENTFRQVWLNQWVKRQHPPEVSSVYDSRGLLVL